MITTLRDKSRKWSYKLAKWMGEEVYSPDSLNTIKEVNNTFQLSAAAYQQALPYESVTQDEIFINRKSIGFGLYLAPSSGADIALVKAHAELIKHRLPKGFDMTVMLYKHHYVAEDLFRGFKPMIEQGGIYESIAKMSLRYHANAVKTGYKNKRNIPAQLTDYQCYIFVSTKNKKEAYQDLCGTRLDFESELTVMGYHHARISGSDFKTLIRVLTAPNLNEVEWPQCDTHSESTLAKGIIPPNTSVVVDEEAIDIKVMDSEGVVQKTRVVSLMIEKWANKFCLWSQPDLFANIFKPDKGIQCPFLVSFTVRSVDAEHLRDESKSKYESLEKSNNKVQRMLNQNLEEELKEWKYCYEQMSKGNLVLNPTFYNVVLFTNEANERTHVTQAINSYREFGFELNRKEMGSWFRFLGSLPFILTEGMFESLALMNHTKTLNHYACANMMPLIADFKGSPKGMLLPTYRHQLAYVDTFDDKNLPISNYNFVTVGSSGSGKSHFTQWRILNGLAQGEKIFVIDLGESYKHLCEITGGTYINASNITLNPFTLFDFDGEIDIDGQVMNNHTQIRDLLAIMASPHAPLSSIQNDYLLEVVLSCWRNYGSKTCMDDVLHELQLMNDSTSNSQDIRLTDLIIHLKKFAREGVYGHMFNSDTPFIANPQFVVLEMGEFEQNPELLAIIMFVMIVIIQGQFYHSDRMLRKLCIIDEAWRFLAQGSNPIAARFIEQGFRTARKYNGGFGVNFQQLEDMMGSIQGKAVASSSDIKFIMRQRNIEQYLTNNPELFSERDQRLIKSFGEAAQQGFSNIMIQYGTATTFHRFFADPFTRVLFSSKAEEFAAIESLQSQGFLLQQAVYKVAEHYYGDELCEA